MITQETNAIGTGSSGIVYLDGNEAVKNATNHEGDVYRAVSGTKGIAPGYTRDGKIRTPYYPQVISIDTIPRDGRSQFAGLVIKNERRINQAIAALTNAGFDYNDPLQFGVTDALEMDLLDFSMADNRYPKEVLGQNLDTLARFYKEFGAHEQAKSISHVREVLRNQSYQVRYGTNLLLGDEIDGINYKILTDKLGNKEARYAYYTTGQEYFNINEPGVAKTENIDGITVVISTRALTDDELSQSNLIRVIDADAGSSANKKFSINTAAPEVFGSSIAELKKLLPHATRNLTSTGKLVIVQAIIDLPVHLRGRGAGLSQALWDGNLAAVEGVYDERADKIYLVADMINKDNIKPVLNHELFHRAEATDPELQSAIARFDKSMRKRFGMAKNGLGTEIEQRAAQRVIEANTHKTNQLAEFKSYLVSEYSKKPASIIGLCRKLILDVTATIRVALWRMGVPLSHLMPADLAALARQAVKITQPVQANQRAPSSVLASACAQGYSGGNINEANEWLQTHNKGWDLSDDARLRRAKDMGFDTDTIWYHWTDTDFDAFDLEYADIGFHFGTKAAAQKRARGRDTIEYEIEPCKEGFEVWSNNEWQGDFSTRSEAKAFVKNQPKTIEPIAVFVKKGETLRVSDAGQWYAWPTIQSLPKNTLDNDDIDRIMRSDNQQAELNSVLLEKGINGLTYKNEVEDKGSISYIALDPRDIRSIHAAFDPAFEHSPRLLASCAMPEKIMINGVPRHTRNSSDQPIEQSKEDLARFYEWFGDSIVTDNKGRPMVIYHGTDQEFSEFKPSKYGSIGPGIYFTTHKGVAEGHGSKVIEAYARIRDARDGMIAGHEVILKDNASIKRISRRQENASDQAEQELDEPRP